MMQVTATIHRDAPPLQAAPAPPIPDPAPAPAPGGPDGPAIPADARPPAALWRGLLLILLAGLALRLLFLPQPGMSGDNTYFQSWAISAVRDGLWPIYTRAELTLNYPPAYLYVLTLDGWIHRALSGLTGQPWPPAGLDPMFFMLHKLNAVIADLGAAALLVLTLWRRVGVRWALAGAATYALNPALIYTSGYWGQADGIVFAGLIAAFCAIVARRPVLAGALLGLAVATKPQTGTLALILGLFLVAQEPAIAASYRPAVLRPPAAEQRAALRAALVRLGLAVAAGAAVIGGLALPFALGGSGRLVLDPYLRAVGHFPLLAVRAFNGWWVFFGEQSGGIVDMDLLLAGIAARRVGVLLFGAALVGIVLVYWVGLRGTFRRPAADTRRPYLTALALATMAWAFFYLPTEVHERYALYALPMLLLAALWRPRGRGLLALVWVASGLALVNLWYVSPLVPLTWDQERFWGNVIGRGVALAYLGVMLVCGWLFWRAARKA